MLERKRLDYRAVEVDRSVAEDLHRRHGTAEVPLLEDEGAPVAGLRAIVSYLERRYAEPSVFPADPQKRNQAATLAEFAEQAIGVFTREVEPSAGSEALKELRSCLTYVREAIARRALGSAAPHLGDLAVAAHLVTCQRLAALDFAREYADLEAYIARVRSTIRAG